MKCMSCKKPGPKQGWKIIDVSYETIQMFCPACAKRKAPAFVAAILARGSFVEQIRHCVLDHGYVQVMATMGDDSLIASLAVATRGHAIKDDDHTKRVISDLLRKKHLTVFEHVVFRLRIKCPVFVARQLMRYRAAVYLEDSRRHLTTPPEFYLPVSKSSGQIYTSHYNICMANYYDLLDRGEPPEQARIVLPLAMYTGYTVTLNARSLIHILDERLEPDVQWETRQYAQSIMDNVLAVALPVTYELWKEDNQ